MRGLASLRRRAELQSLECAFQAGCERNGFRVVHYSIQTNHLHLLAEAQDRHCLARVARALNRLWHRSGRVFAERYHGRLLRTPRQVRSALAYVLCNARKHRARLSPHGPDPYSSGRWFEGWRDALAPCVERVAQRPIARARTWLLNVGWLRHGRIRFAEIPGAA